MTCNRIDHYVGAPLISVIIPVRNGELTLERCLNSIVKQSISQYEIIVVDNSSNDSTPDIVRSFSSSDPRIVYRFEPRRGRGPARAEGIRVSRGSVLAWTDADCEVPTDWLERIIEPIMKSGEGVVQGNEDLMQMGFWSNLAQDAGQRHYEGQILDPPYIDHVDTKNFAIRKDILMEIGGFDRRLRALEDFELKIRLKRSGYRTLFLRDLRVKHYHRETFFDLFRSRFEQGFWAAVIFYLHRDFFDSEKGRDNTIKSMYIKDVIMFPMHLALFLLRYGPRKFFFEAITGYIWRLGNFKGRLLHRKILEERSNG